MAREMVMMKRMLEEAGLKPVSEVVAEVERSKKSKKRLPSGSPDGKMIDSDSSGSSSGSGSEDNQMDDEYRVLKRPDFRKKDRQEVKKLSKRAAKKVRRIARAKENFVAVNAAKIKASELPESNVPAKTNTNPNAQVNAQVSVPPHEQAPAPVSGPSGSSSRIRETITQTRLYSEIIAHGSGSGQRQDGSAGDDLPAITPVFKTPSPDGPYRDEIVVEVLQIDGRDFIGTITPTEARRKIFEEMLGLDQDILTGITLGFNRGRIITYKLKQQLDIDQLYRKEFFDFQRTKGKEVMKILCKIRGLKDPSRRSDQATRPVRQPHDQYADDGTRIVRIIGCEYRLLESEILDWLSLYGEVISEITEEPYEDEDEQEAGEKLPPIGNGTYQVKMRMKRDMPNWVPMYGRKVCLSYRGIKKQCNSCFGPHLRKFCMNEKMSLEEYADKFRLRNKYVPEQFYGKLAKFENIAEQQKKLTDEEKKSAVQIPGSGTVACHESSGISANQTQIRSAPNKQQSVPANDHLKVTYRRSDGDVWSLTTVPMSVTVPQTANPTVGSVAEGVSSFLHGIRASFRSENVNVMPMQRQTKNTQEKKSK